MKQQLCRVSFWYNGQYKVLHQQRFKTRQEALSHVKNLWRGASQISIMFYVPQNETEETIHNETENN